MTKGDVATEAVKWFGKSAAQGIAKAQYELGLCYYEGHGIDQDDKKAEEWFRKAADKGHKKSQYILSLCF